MRGNELIPQGYFSVKEKRGDGNSLTRHVNLNLNFPISCVRCICRWLSGFMLAKSGEKEDYCG